MALKAVAQVSSPTLQRGRLKRWEEQRLPPSQEGSRPSTPTSQSLQCVPAGVSERKETLQERAQAILLNASDPKPAERGELDSRLSGGGFYAPPTGRQARGERAGSDRGSTPRCHSPRYLQATMASALRYRGEQKTDVMLMAAAGGESNIASKYTMDLSNEPGQPPRRLRRSLSAPRSRAKEVMYEQYEQSSHQSRARQLAHLPPHEPTRSGSVSAHDVPSLSKLRRPPRSSHDKSIANPPRSHRGPGLFVPHPVLTSVEALAASKEQFHAATGLGDAVKHRGRGLASPMKMPRAADPNPAYECALATLPRTLDGAGVASTLTVRDSLLNGRRARGLCSPSSMRSQSPLQWD
ncbi:MAG: hypothetical protein SGPRY_009118 [Prymnesium sp.]